MISYEDLCQALDRFNGKIQRQAEFDRIEEAMTKPNEDESEAAETSQAQVSGESWPVDDESAKEIETNLPASQNLGNLWTQEKTETQAEAPGEVQDSPEDTHEIDFDEVEVEENK